MKNLFILLFILFTVQFLFNGCDSPSGSKPDVVAKPVLVSPVDKATNVSLTPLFKWTGTADKLEIATNPSFGAGDIMHSAAVSGQQYSMPSNKLQRGITYYWRAGKTTGTSIDWSASIFSFTTTP
jgi:hypothetical protein